MKKNYLKYSVGLDIGTNSVGWAVINENGKLIKTKSRNMWGVRLFDSANSAANRRTSRSVRRRYNKRRERIRLLRLLMNELIEPLDSTFFLRMENVSFLTEEDKAFYLKEKYINNYNLFIDSNFNDRDYYKRFPTIYHLRDYLCKSKQKEDPRLIYLALHHMVKYRGNFLYEGQTIESSSSILGSLKHVFDLLTSYNQKKYVSEEVLSSLVEMLSKTTARKEKVDQIIEVLQPEKEDKKVLSTLFTGIVGNAFDLSNIINELRDHKNLKLKFSDDNYETKLDEISNDIDEYVEMINAMHDVYSAVELSRILGESGVTLSEAMIKRYEKHHDDLVLLKSVIKRDNPKKYNEVFRNENKDLKNYVNYIKHPSKVDMDSFYKYIKSILKSKDHADVLYILSEMEKENFLLKHNSRLNMSVPYQLQKQEMELILNNQSLYYPCLKNNYDKILSILTFRIPYYYGPLANKHPNHWIIKKDEYKDERILPWNHDKVVDVDKTVEAFITNLTNFCTYLPYEKVMPKNSLIAQKYEVLSELNKIRVNGHLIPVDVKREIVDDLFMSYKTITKERLQQWFIKNQVYLNNEDLTITGFQKEDAFASSLSSWIDFKKIFNESTFDVDTIEDVIFDLTVFEDKKILAKRLQAKNIDKETVRKIIKLNYKGWSRLSKKLINGIYCDNRFGSSATILDVMEYSHLNLMEIINDKSLGYKQVIDDENYKDSKGHFDYDDVAALACSPADKRGIWQTLKILEEIVKIMGHKPDNVYVEFARQEQEKKRTTSRVDQMKKIYSSIEKESGLLNTNVYNQLKNEKELTDRLYLYYMQMGKCMYTGEKLEIDELYNYDIDHIVPRSLIKDDSLDNKVLVKSVENQRKLDDVVIPSSIQTKMFTFWNKLYNSKLISSKKYYSLIKTEYSDKDKERFINRQLVETRQITKNVVQLIKNEYTDTKVVSIRAHLVSSFRDKYHIYKNRSVNDYHHAHDAYICCILGEYIKKRFPKLEAKYIYGEYMYFLKENRKGNDGFILNSMNYTYVNRDTGEVLWHPSYLTDIKKCFSYKDYFITKKLEDNDGELFKVTVLPSLKNRDKTYNYLLPVNKYRSDTDKYGGFSGFQYRIYAIEGYDKKHKLERKIVGVPLFLVNSSMDQRIKYIEDNEKLKEVRIIREIKVNQLIEMKDHVFYMTSANELVNARQLWLDEHHQRLIYLLNRKEFNHPTVNHESVDELYNHLIDKMATYYVPYETEKNKFVKMQDDFTKLSIEDKYHVLSQILVILQANASNGNIKLANFNFGDRIGRRGGQNIKLDQVTFIEQSITGIYSKKVKL